MMAPRWSSLNLPAARRLALRYYGLMAITVLNEWGIRSTSDIGEIVYNLIASGDLDKTPTANGRTSMTCSTSPGITAEVVT